MTVLDPKPRLAITLGDVAGIGPEVVVRALTDPLVRDLCRPVVIGDPAVVERAARALSIPVDVCATSQPTEWREASDEKRESDHLVSAITCFNPIAPVGDVPLGHDDSRAGRAAYEWVVAAAHLALRGEVDGIVTAPFSKLSLDRAGISFPGHTEILEHECGVHGVRMMLYLPPGQIVAGPHGLAVAHVTLHTSIASVPGLLSTQRIIETIRLIDLFLRRLGGPAPRIGVCALNPHAGEGGLFGDEERRIIEPAVAQARSESIAASGPYPADTLLKRAVDGEFDGVAAMYHDQGHIALKLIAFGRAVNVTLGLPIVRTSPSHGTAFDIAGRGVANPTGMIEAIKVAAMLVKAKSQEEGVGSGKVPAC